MSRLKVLSVIGTRPEVVKMAPIVRELAAHEKISSRVVVTAQHRDMLDQALRVFGIQPDYDFDVMKKNQSLSDVFALVMQKMQPVLTTSSPDWVLVQGDTTTVLAAALAASYQNVPVGHVEAGLRTYDRNNPFPEELNRVLVDHISELCFAPTEVARQALLKEGIPSHRIHVTGNTVIDSLRYIASQPAPSVPFCIPDHHRLILVTAHRRENHGQPLLQIASALRILAARSDVTILFPVHPNPNVRRPVGQMLADIPNVILCGPLDYFDFVYLMKRAYLILTDSGGIQEEATSLGVPVLVLRSVTERPEAVAAGVARVVGTNTDTIVGEATRLLDDTLCHAEMARAGNPYGDGTAASRIVSILREATSLR